jgi:hypothetical protein
MTLYDVLIYGMAFVAYAVPMLGYCMLLWVVIAACESIDKRR